MHIIPRVIPSVSKKWHFWIVCQIKTVKHFREICLMYGWLKVLIYHNYDTKKNLKITHWPFLLALGTENYVAQELAVHFGCMSEKSSQRRNWWWSGEFMMNYDGYGFVPCMTCPTTCPRPTQPHSTSPLSHNMYHHLTNNTQQHRYHYQCHSR